MYLVITIPAYNEEKTVGQVIEEIPKKIPGIKKINVLVINDGSSDRTVDVAREKGAIVISNKENRGLATTFKRGLEKALQMGADIIVNTDADNQYDQRQIPDLIRPIVEGKADMVLGSRFKGTIEYMPSDKKWGNRISSWVVRRVSGLPISDAQTGFRAFSREAAMRMNIQASYTYTQETILQAAAAKLVIKEIPITFRKREGNSRLISNIFNYAKRVSVTLLIGYLNYKPLKVFLGIGVLFFLVGFTLGLRVLFHYLSTGFVTPFIPTAILTTIFIIFGFQVIVIGLIAEMVKQQRRLSEENLYMLRSKRE